MNQDNIAAAVKVILSSIGEDVEREGLRDTPKRVARMYAELCTGYQVKDPKEILATTFDEDHQELVIVKDIPFYSLCEHHMVPFFGHVHIGYIPNGKVVGISKMARLVECFARRLQIQERMVTQIADTIDEALRPLGVGVIIEAEHLCMTMRGVQKPGTKTVTSAMRGIFIHAPQTRSEFLALIKKGGK